MSVNICIFVAVKQERNEETFFGDIRLPNERG